MAMRAPKILSHPLCLMGIPVAGVGLAASAVALVIDVFQEETRPYQGLLTFGLFPGVMLVGLAMTAAGALLERRRRRRLEAAHEEWRPVLDPHRRMDLGLLVVMGLGLLVFIVLSIVGSYKAYEFTETPTFCGAVCHQPMGPEYTAYQDSPHASVSCAECHVGPGMDNYVAAKVSGLRQVFQVLTDGYERPIRAPRDKLLPAVDTCEHCHWPEKFWGMAFNLRARYGYDPLNSRRFLQVLPKVGGGNGEGAPPQGIHAHMNIRNQVNFRSADEKGEEIPWVRVVHEDGTEVVYRDRESRLSPKSIERLDEQVMDCLDCHNRPAHRFLPPDEAIDRALEAGTLDPSIPYLKKIAVEALGGQYATTEEARDAIRSTVESYYRDNFEGKVLTRKETLDQAVLELQRIYERNVFPDMNIDWLTYPDHSGHRNSPGCFRCHSGRHASADGRKIPSNCDLCHVFVRPARDSASMVEVSADTTFLHPFRSADHAQVACWQCHAGSRSPYAECRSCHEQQTAAHAMRFECSICHEPGADEVTEQSCQPCHPVGNSPLHAHPDHRACLDCHQPHDWAVPYWASCLPCHETLGEDTWEEHYPEEKSCHPCHDFGGVERQLLGLPVSRGS